MIPVTQNSVSDYIITELRASFKELRDDNRSFQSDVRRELESLKDTIHDQTASSIELHSKLPRLEEDVSKLIKTIHLGNGSPPIVLQLSSIRDSLGDVESRLEEAHSKRDTLIIAVQELATHINAKANATELTDKEIKRLKWSTYGKIAAALSLTIPGVIAFISTLQ
jgi:chromosome segregation ATPase